MRYEAAAKIAGSTTFFVRPRSDLMMREELYSAAEIRKKL